MTNRPILIMAGGTGGHVYPALAVARALLQEAKEVIWLGSRRGLESVVVPENGIPIEWVIVSGLRGKGLFALLIAPFTLTRALFQCLFVMWRHRPAAVLGMGGYVSGPGGLAAWLTRCPLVIHEQNAVAGLTNRLLARLARVVLQAFPGSFKSNDGAKTVGNPVRVDISSIVDPDTRLRGRTGAMRLLVLGGSQGAMALNRGIPEALALVPEEIRPIVRHQTGERTIDVAEETYRACGVAAKLYPFINDIAEAYAWADFVVCRAGALTIAELSAVGLPAIFVPFPAAVDDHQTANAQAMAASGAATIMQERNMTRESMAILLESWLKNRSDLLVRARQARSLAMPESLIKITDHCLMAAGGSS